MTALVRALWAEQLKLRGTLALWMCLVAPALVVGLYVLQILTRFTGGAARTPPPPAEAWLMFAQSALGLWAFLMLPLLVTLQAALLAGLEHQVAAAAPLRVVAEDQPHRARAAAVGVHRLLREDRGGQLAAALHRLIAVAPQRGQALLLLCGLGLGLELPAETDSVARTEHLIAIRVSPARAELWVPAGQADSVRSQLAAQTRARIRQPTPGQSRGCCATRCGCGACCLAR